MEKKTITIEVTVLTSRWQDRDVEHDMDRLLVPLRKIESGQTTVEDFEIMCIR